MDEYLDGYLDADIETLEQCRLFAHMPRGDIRLMLACAHARRAGYEKGETLLREGDAVTEAGVVLSGRGRSVMWDASGKALTVVLLEKGDFVGILLAASRERKSPVTVQALSPMAVLYVPFQRIISPCARACPRHGVFLRNCFDAVAEQSLALHDRIACLIRPGIREKILAYLSRLANERGSRTFTIPLDRCAMAEYLNTDRSALSRELSRMKREGLIDYYKNSFRLLF